MKYLHTLKKAPLSDGKGKEEFVIQFIKYSKSARDLVPSWIAKSGESSGKLSF